MVEIGEFFRAAGGFIWVNVFVSVAAVTVVCERIYRVYFVYSIAAEPFLDQMEKLIRTNNIDRAIRACNAAPAAALPRVVRAALMRAHNGRQAIAAAIEEATLEVQPQVMRRIQTLWTFANIATLVGLIGTIFGLIKAFAAVGMASPETRSQILTEGISEAMNHTAMGLSIAVSCIVFHLFLNTSARGIVEHMELGAVRVENLLLQRAAGTLDSSEEKGAKAGAGVKAKA